MIINSKQSLLKGLNVTELAEYGPKSCVSITATFLTSQNLTIPNESQETIVSPYQKKKFI